MLLVEMGSSLNATYRPSLSKYSHLFFGNGIFAYFFLPAAAEAVSLQCFSIIMQRSLLVFNLCSYYVFSALSTWNKMIMLVYFTRFFRISVKYTVQHTYYMTTTWISGLEAKANQNKSGSWASEMRLNAFLSLFVNLENRNDYTVFFAKSYTFIQLHIW